MLRNKVLVRRGTTSGDSGNNYRIMLAAFPGKYHSGGFESVNAAVIDCTTNLDPKVH